MIYIPSAARLSHRKEPRGGKHLSLLLTTSIAPEQGDAGTQAAPASHRPPLSQRGSPQKQRQGPSKGQAEREGKENTLLGFGWGAEPSAMLQPYLPTPNQGVL